MLEAAAQLAPTEPVRSLSADLRRRRLRRARTCYGHMAGRLGVELLCGMVRNGWIEGHDGSFRSGVEQLSSTGPDAIYRLTSVGAAELAGLGLLTADSAGLRHCVDWSEQRHHLAGAVGTRLASRLFELGWLQRGPRGREVTIIGSGAPRLREAFGVDPELGSWPGSPAATSRASSSIEARLIVPMACALAVAAAMVALETPARFWSERGSALCEYAARSRVRTSYRYRQISRGERSGAYRRHMSGLNVPPSTRHATATGSATTSVICERSQSRTTPNPS